MPTNSTLSSTIVEAPGFVQAGENSAPPAFVGLGSAGAEILDRLTGTEGRVESPEYGSVQNDAFAASDPISPVVLPNG
jgi:hypothetical protein